MIPTSLVWNRAIKARASFPTRSIAAFPSVRPGYHIVVSLAPEFDARVYYVSRNEQLHPEGWIVQCEQRYVLPSDFVTPFDTFSQALDFVARDIQIYNLFYASCCTRDGFADRMDR